MIKSDMRELELYIHIPFCAAKCRYCDFLSAPAGEKERGEYVNRLCGRIRSWGGYLDGYRVSSLFLGGGTPSLLRVEQTEEIFRAVREGFSLSEDAEITTEMNPGTVTAEKLAAYRELGVNRLSIGLQSADNRELRILGRIHTWETFLATFRMAREAGFSNINVDLMSAIPFQTLKSYEMGLRSVAELSPEHLSAYSLIIEEGTPFYERYGGGAHGEELPDEDEERRMYVRTREILAEYGYHRYEISNYAREGYECRHNLGYWDRKEYLGIGAGAASLVNRCRWREPEKLPPRWSLEDRREFVRLTVREEMEEFLFLGLRKIRGIRKQDFFAYFGETLESRYGSVIRELKEQGLLSETEETLYLTDRGIDVSNYALSRFLR